MQRDIAKEAVWSAGQEPIAFRIGISIGETIAADNDLHGHSINLAARIQALAAPGGICVTDTIQRLVHGSPELSMRSIGLQQLKNIAAPVEVFVIEGLTSETPLVKFPVRQPAPAERKVLDTSLAVLPFENASGDPADLHLCQGVVADLITDLCRFRNLMVIARHSAFLAASQTSSIREIGNRLGVRYLLSGSFRRIGSHLRVAVDLVEAQSEKTIWSERFDGTIADVFDFQDAVTATIASRLAVQIDLAERRRLSMQHHPDLHAYGLILRGQDLNKYPEDLEVFVEGLRLAGLP
jgi:TolB-like protein